MENSKETLTFVGLMAAGIIICVIIAALPVGLGIVGLILAIIALIAAVIGFSSSYYFYMFEPAVRAMQTKSSTIVLSNEEPFYMAPSGSAILKRVPDGVYATSFIKIPVYKSATEMTDEEKYDFSSTFTKLLNLSRDPMKICSLTHVINKDDYINRIRARLSEVEERYNTIVNDKNSPKSQVDRVKGEATMWHNLLDNVTAANSKSQTVYAMVSQLGANEEEASNLINIKAIEVAAGIGATLGVTATVVSGAEMLTLIEPDYIVPPATISEMLKRRGTTEA